MDNDSVTLVYEWRINGQLQSESSDVLSGPFLVGDLILCRATPDDGKDSGLPLEASVTVLNTDPLIDSIAISPNSGVTSQSLLGCQVSASDVDGGSPTVAYAWTLNGNLVGSAVQLAIERCQCRSGSDVVVCTATVTDSDGGTAMDSATVSVDNSDPTFSVGASISPSTGVHTGTVLSCTAAGSDVDGGTVVLSYAWWNGSQLLGSGQSLTVDASTSDVGDTLSCVVTATDLDGGSAVSTDSAVVENTAPLVDSASVAPSSGVNTSSVLSVWARK